MAFQFGTTAAALTAAGAAGAGAVPTAAAGFSFGGTTTTTAAATAPPAAGAAGAGAVPAATAGFSFGGTTTTTTATPGTTATAIPVTGFSFGASTTASSSTAPPPTAPPSVSLFGVVPPKKKRKVVVATSMATATADSAGTTITTTTTVPVPIAEAVLQAMNVKELKHQLRHRGLSICGVKTNLQERLQVAVDTKVPYFTDAQLEEAQNHKKAAPNKKKAALNKKKGVPNKKKKGVPNKKKKGVPNKKKKGVPKKPDMVLTRSNALSHPRGKGKESVVPFPQREGRNFDAATTDCLSEAVSEEKVWKDLFEYCRNHPNLDSPILPATLSSTLQEVKVIICKHFPGDNHFDEMTEDGLLWVTRNGYLGEICLCFLTSTVNRTIHHTEDLQGDCRDSIAFTDINMCPAPNKCGGDHNHEALQALTENVLIATIRLCPKAKIVFFGKKPNHYAVNGFLQRLQKEGLADRFPEEFRQGSDSFFSNCLYLTHSQFFLMQRNTIDHTKDLFRFVAFVIHAIFGKDIRNTLLTMDEAGLQQIVPFANQAMIDARSQAQSDLMKALWDDPNHVFNSTTHHKKLSEAKSAYYSDPKNEAILFHPKAKTHIRNQWKRSGQLRKPYQCAKCGKQYVGENCDYLQHMENCNHNPVLFTSAKLQHQELPGNSPTTVKEDSKKMLEERKEDRRQRLFIINRGNFHRLQKNLHKYKRPIDKLQKNKIERQVQYEISEMQREKEELQRRIQDKNNKGWIKTPLPEGVFDNVDMDGNVDYTMGPYKYNLEWYDFQNKCDQDQSYKYPPFATDYEKNWKPRKEGYLIRQKKRDDELFKKYGTKVIRTTE